MMILHGKSGISSSFLLVIFLCLGFTQRHALAALSGACSFGELQEASDLQFVGCVESISYRGGKTPYDLAKINTDGMVQYTIQVMPLCVLRGGKKIKFFSIRNRNIMPSFIEVKHRIKSHWSPGASSFSVIPGKVYLFSLARSDGKYATRSIRYGVIPICDSLMKWLAHDKAKEKKAMLPKKEPKKKDPLSLLDSDASPVIIPAVSDAFIDFMEDTDLSLRDHASVLKILLGSDLDTAIKKRLRDADKAYRLSLIKALGSPARIGRGEDESQTLHEEPDQQKVKGITQLSSVFQFTETGKSKDRGQPSGDLQPAFKQQISRKAATEDEESKAASQNTSLPPLAGFRHERCSAYMPWTIKRGHKTIKGKRYMETQHFIVTTNKALCLLVLTFLKHRLHSTSNLFY